MQLLLEVDLTLLEDDLYAVDGSGSNADGRQFLLTVLLIVPIYNAVVAACSDQR